MSFVQREIDALRSIMGTTDDKEQYDRLYIAMQALEWTLEPSAIRSPVRYLVGDEEVPLSERKPPLAADLTNERGPALG